jgi:magnesium transporter
MSRHLDFSAGLLPQQMHHPVGEFLVPVETAFNEELCVQELLNLLPNQEVRHQTHYIYTVDAHGRLSGVLSTRQILFSNARTQLKEIAKPYVVRIDSHAPLEACLKMMAEHELLAIPVTDKDKFLLGIFEIPVTAFEKLNKKPEAKELFQIIGIHLSHHKRRTVFSEYRYRMPWLFFNIVGGLCCAYIGSMFHQLLDDIVIISMYIPLVLTLGEAIAMQSMALSLEFIEYGQIPWKKVRSRLKLDLKTSLFIGLTAAMTTAMAYFLGNEALAPITAIATSIAICMILATQIGALCPILLHAVKLDPKVAAGPVALMVTDICVTILYLTLSSLLLIN